MRHSAILLAPAVIAIIYNEVVGERQYDLLGWYPRPPPQTTTTPRPPLSSGKNGKLPPDSRWEVVSLDAANCDTSPCGCGAQHRETCFSLYDVRADAYACAQTLPCRAWKVQYMRARSFNVCQVGRMYAIPIDPAYGNDDNFWAAATDILVYIPVVNDGGYEHLRHGVAVYPPLSGSDTVVGPSSGGTSCTISYAEYHREEDIDLAEVRLLNSTALIIDLHELLEGTYLGRDHNILFVRSIKETLPPVMIGGYKGMIATIIPEPDSVTGLLGRLTVDGRQAIFVGLLLVTSIMH